jgi:hypothetical protein
MNDKKDYLLTKLHLLEVEKAYLEATAFLCRKLDGEKELFLTFDEIVTLIKVKIQNPSDWNKLDIEQAYLAWNIWRTSKHEELSIKDLFKRLDPANKPNRFVSWVIARKLVINIKPQGQDFYFNPSFKSESYNSILNHVRASAILNYYLIDPAINYD